MSLSCAKSQSTVCVKVLTIRVCVGAPKTDSLLVDYMMIVIFLVFPYLVSINMLLLLKCMLMTLTAGLRPLLQSLFDQLQKLWKGSAPDFLGVEKGDVDALRFLGLDIELGPGQGTWIIHQRSYICAFVLGMFSDCLKERRTPCEPETFSEPSLHVLRC